MANKTNLEYELEITQYRVLLAEMMGYLNGCVELQSPMPVKTAEEYHLKIKTVLDAHASK